MNTSPPQDYLKGTIPLEEAIIEELQDAGKPYAFAVMNGDERITIAAKSETEKGKVPTSQFTPSFSVLVDGASSLPF